ncbi:MAG: CzcABC family efflux RND transporter, transmembrane protein [Nitrospira sp.]|nr:MAG: CzcABC family efflux RND transporter, transmembrane protein [Nitrospira sp.]
MSISHVRRLETERSPTPLATVVIGGLITSTVLTLFVIPVRYRRFRQPGAT